MNPLVSIVIPTYKGEKYIAAAVASALAQTYRPLEVIVINDDSPDRTEDVLRPFLSEIRYIKKQNSGPAGARNAGIREAKGEFIAFLDGDDIWMPEKLEKQMKLFDDQDVGLVYADMSVIDAAGHPMEYHVDKPRPEGQVFEKLFQANFIPTSTVVIRKSCLEKAGYFNESWPCVEDYDLWLRVTVDCRVRHLAERLTQYRRHPNNLSGNVERSYFYEKEILDAAFRNFKNRFQNLVKIKNKRMAILYFDLGMEYWERSDFKKCRDFWKMSLSFNPWSWKRLFYYVSAFLGPKWIGFCRRLKKSK